MAAQRGNNLKLKGIQDKPESLQSKGLLEGDQARQTYNTMKPSSSNQDGNTPNTREAGKHKHDTQSDNGTASSSNQEGCTPNTRETGRCIMITALVFLLYSPLKFYSSCKIHVSWTNLFWFGITVGKIVSLIVFTLDIGSARSQLGVVVTTGYISLQHLLLKDWDAGLETVPYPPAQGEFAVYTLGDLEAALNFAVEQYYNVEAKATGYFMHTATDSIVINIKYFNWTKDATTGRYSGLVIEEKSFKPDHGLSNYTEGGLTLYKYNITTDLQTTSPSIFQTVLTVRMNLSLHSVRVFDDSGAMCLLIQANVTFQDNDHNGQVVANLTTLTTVVECSSIGYDIAVLRQLIGIRMGDVHIFLLADLLCYLFLSTLLHIDRGSKKLCEKCAFTVTLLVVGISCLINFATTIVWIIVAVNRGCKHNHLTTLRDMDQSTVVLGYGLVLSFISLLRFVKINRNFSILFKTLRRASGAIISFLFCVLILFFGFVLFAYIVLGTYHVKFRDFLTSADTLFSIIYGDEIFATLAISQDEYAGDIELINTTVHVFVYIYVLIFTLLVFNLLIALFNSAYKEVKKSARTSKNVEDKLREALTIILNDNTDGIQTVKDKLKCLIVELKAMQAGNPTITDLVTAIMKSCKKEEAIEMKEAHSLVDLIPKLKNQA